MPIPILQRFRAALSALVMLGVAAAAVSGGATTLNLSNTAASGVTPAGMTLSATAGPGGFQTIGTLNATTKYFYDASQTLTIPAGTWNVLLWTTPPASSSVQRVDILKAAADGSSATVLGSATVDILNTGTGNHPSTFAIALGTQSLANQRIVVAVTRTSGADATLAYGSDFPSRLEYPTGAVPSVPLAITSQPANTTVNEGETATFTVGATASNGTLTYQWYLGTPTSRVAIAGATSASYTTGALTVAANNATYYHVIVKSPGAISLTSYNAKLTVGPPKLTITAQPANLTAVVGATATFTVAATSSNGVLTYQWYKGIAPSGVLVTGATSASYTTPATTLANSGDIYYVIVRGNDGAISLTSYNVKLTVADKVTITKQAANATVNVGQTATFTVQASTSNGVLTYQWYKGKAPSGVLIAGATSASYTTPATQITDNGNIYYVIVKGSAGVISATSYNVKLTVVSTTILITTQPLSQSVVAGKTATFLVLASSPATMTYQWYKGASSASGALIAGATAASYTTPATVLTDTGSQFCVKVSSTGYASVDSSAATLTVTAAPPPSLYAWNDEFDGPYLDRSKWSFDLGNGNYGWGNGEFENYTSSKDNVDIENGNLVITARKEDLDGRHFTSARLLTRGKANFQYGHVEARIKFPTGGQMIWPCFWMMGDTSTGWPKTNEIDIAEMFGGTYVTSQHTFGDNVVGAHVFWWSENMAGSVDNGGQADSGDVTALSSTLGSAYRTYALEWTPNYLKAFVWDDGQTINRAKPYWSISLVDKNFVPTATMSELHIPDYLLLNFAIGLPQGGMTSADQAALLPQKFYIDYVRVSDVPASTFDVYEKQPDGTYAKAATLNDPGIAAIATDKTASQWHGNLGVKADATTCPTNLDFATDANLFVWSNTMTAATCSRAGGFALKQDPSQGWFGAGIATTYRHNMLNYAGGALHVSVKTASTDPFLIGVSGGDGGNSWVTLTNGGIKSYDFARDNQWHDITIPMVNFGGSDFTDVSQFFMFMSGTSMTPGQTYEFDNIYWSENDANNIVQPVGTKFGIVTSSVCDAGSYNRDADGAVNNWNPSNGTISTGSLGTSNSIAFAASQGAWYGMGLAGNKLYNLSAFATGHLHFSLKVASGGSTSMFRIGLKSPGGPSVRESWIKMGGADYPVVADGAFHDYSVPSQEFLNSDFSAISQLLMIAGNPGPINLEIANVYFTSN